MASSIAFWKQKHENLKTVGLTFFKLQSILTQSIYGQRPPSIVLVHLGDNLQLFMSNTFRFLAIKNVSEFLIYRQIPLILPH